MSITSPATIFCVALSIGAFSCPTAAEVRYFGPVELREGQSYELCASSPNYAQALEVQASFYLLSDSSEALRTVQRTFDQGEGGCIKVDHDSVGPETLFAVLQYDDGLSNDDKPVGNACVINGVFPVCPPPIDIAVVEQGGAVRERATFGPVRLKPDSRLEICANNLLNNVAGTEVTVNFYRARSSSEPFASRMAVLEAGAGACASVSYNRVGDIPIFAELVYNSTGSASPAATLVNGAAIINGIFEPLPASDRQLSAVL